MSLMVNFYRHPFLALKSTVSFRYTFILQVITPPEDL